MNVVAPAALEGDSPAAAALRAMHQVISFVLASGDCHEPPCSFSQPWPCGDALVATLSPSAMLWPGSCALERLCAGYERHDQSFSVSRNVALSRAATGACSLICSTTASSAEVTWEG